jgi:Predicted transcriptional regulator
MAQKQLTKAEEQVMQFLWKLERGFLKDILESFPDPKPAYTTVSTVIRVLVRKKFIGFKTYGKINEYYPLVSKKAYFNSRLKPIISGYFTESTSNLTSYFLNSKLNLTELEELQQLIGKKIAEVKSKSK